MGRRLPQYVVFCSWKFLNRHVPTTYDIYAGFFLGSSIRGMHSTTYLYIILLCNVNDLELAKLGLPHSGDYRFYILSNGTKEVDDSKKKYLNQFGKCAKRRYKNVYFP
jgi:hypothetical protein